MDRTALGGDSSWMSNATARPSSIGAYITSMGWLDEPVVAAGQLRQGRPPTIAGLITGYALVEILRPRRSKLLPRNFVLAVTGTQIVAFKAWCGGEGTEHTIGIRPGVRSSFARDEVQLTDLRDGSESKGATMCVRGERFPVARPNLTGDWDTDELIALLGGLAPASVPRQSAWAAFSL
jgi:hypothetical protein